MISMFVGAKTAIYPYPPFTVRLSSNVQTFLSSGWQWQCAAKKPPRYCQNHGQMRSRSVCGKSRPSSAARLGEILALLLHEKAVQLEVFANDGFADGGHGSVWSCQTIDRSFEQRLRNRLAPANLPDSFREDEFDFAAADFLVELHRGQKFLTLEG